MGSRLYVGNIPFNTDETQLRTFFEEGNRQVASVKIIMDRETGRPRGFAFVDMATDEEAQNAITAFHGKEFGGRTLTVNEARERQPGERSGGFDRAPRTGGYQGGGGGGGGYQGGGDRGGYQGGGGDNRGGYQGGAPRPGGYQGGGGDNRGGYQGGDNRSGGGGYQGGDNRGGGGGYQGGGDRGGYQGGDNRGGGGGYQGGNDRGGYQGGGGGDDRGNRGGYQGGGDRGGYQGGGGGRDFGPPPNATSDDRGNRTRDYERRTQNKNRGGAYERDRGRRNFDDDDESY